MGQKMEHTNTSLVHVQFPLDMATNSSATAERLHNALKCNLVKCCATAQKITTEKVDSKSATNVIRNGTI